jgi:hypothetical protein
MHIWVRAPNSCLPTVCSVLQFDPCHIVEWSKSIRSMVKGTWRNLERLYLTFNELRKNLHKALTSPRTDR